MGNHPLKRVEQGRLAVPSIRTDLCELCISAVKFYGTIRI